MRLPRRLSVLYGFLLLLPAATLFAQPEQETFPNPDCPYFGADRERYATDALRKAGGARDPHNLTRLTTGVTAMLGYIPGGSRTYNFDQQHTAGSIDSYIFGDLKANGINPAPRTTDWEFIRRVTLDLTGRIPSSDQVLIFVADTSADKRAKLVEDLLSRPEWVDKWTMYFGDLYKNTANRSSTSVNRFPQGRNAFYQWIKDSLSSGKPYNEMASELIGNSSGNTYNDGAANFLVGSVVGGGPVQDIMDQMASDTMETFLGVSHVNCLLCHNGRGHLDSLSLWGQQTTRYQAWQLAAFMSRTQASRVNYDPTNNNVYYWSLQDNAKAMTTDYALNTTTGNRPARVAPTGCKSGQPCYYVPPQYIFNGQTGRSGDYRGSFAKSVTGDFQFARATVNYLWAYFFGRGIVDPPNTFDPARLDPDNPPPAPWTLQPSNPRLLNALAQHFIDSGYNVKAIMREIADSDTYQLSSRYDGTWKAEYEPYFARKFVRRLWGEEIVDAISLSSGTYPSYSIGNFTELGFGKVSFAMQFPDTQGGPDGTTNAFLDTFLRGNRDDQPRKNEGSILQALNLMNNGTMIENRLALTGTAANQLLLSVRSKGATDLVNTLYLHILSRYPTTDELSKASAVIPAASGTPRDQAIQDLAWTLYNKVDFVFNY